MFTRIVRLVALLLTLALPASLSAQTALNETTTAAAMTASQTTIQVASATGAVAGGGIYLDREYMTIASNYTSGTTIPVIRAGRASSHAASVPVYIAPAAAFVNRDYDGSCVAAAESFLPRVNVTNGNIWDCNSTVEKWVNLRELVPVTCQTGPLATGSVDQSCFTANRPYLVYRINYVAKTADAAGTVTLIPRRQQGTEAPASGDALATAINCVAGTTPAETVVTATLTATESLLILATGDRLGLDFTDDVPGELLGVVVTFYLYPL
jgi:hypothetical protein